MTHQFSNMTNKYQKAVPGILRFPLWFVKITVIRLFVANFVQLFQLGHFSCHFSSTKLFHLGLENLFEVFVDVVVLLEVFLESGKLFFV